MLGADEHNQRTARLNATLIVVAIVSFLCAIAAAMDGHTATYVAIVAAGVTWILHIWRPRNHQPVDDG